MQEPPREAADGGKGAPGEEEGEAVASYEEYEPLESEPFDWVVFALRVSAILVVGAMLVTSVDLSQNRGAEWLEVLRLAMLPFVGGMLLFAAAELVDRQGE